MKRPKAKASETVVTADRLINSYQGTKIFKIYRTP